MQVLNVSTLPACVQYTNMKVTQIFYSSSHLEDEGIAVASGGVEDMNTTVSAVDKLLGLKNNSSLGTIFIAGDQSSVGKSSTCLGDYRLHSYSTSHFSPMLLCTAILASLVKLGISPDHLAYIKPATQCEQEQAVTKYCSDVGISHRGIGPVVFYKGFTRAYLQGQTESSEAMLQKICDSVEEIGRGKKLVIVDGVGYPSVGSICNLSNADVAGVLNSPVVLIGRSGVGNAVDSYNLNARYFESSGVQVLGAIFNKLPLEGYYNLESCKASVSDYFRQYRKDQRVYGFVPIITIPSTLSDIGSDDRYLVDSKSDPSASTALAGNTAILNTPAHISALVDAFTANVDMGRLIIDIWKHKVSSIIFPRTSTACKFIFVLKRANVAVNVVIVKWMLTRR